jgi:AcrR family transcriptional regulator
VSTAHSGGGDPARTLALLWGRDTTRSRGPKPRLSVHRIALAAIEVADADGLDALSMRRVAERLGVGTMSLYTYVPGKAELIDVMLDAVHAEPGPAAAPGGGWREKLEQVARANWDLARRHPWIPYVSTASRPPMGPGSISKYERELAAVADSGLDDVEMDAVITLINQYVHSAARGAADAADIERSSGLDDQAWWAATAPWLDKVFDPGRYPLAARVGSAAGEHHNAAYDPHHAFEFGLQRILDGIEVLIQRRAAT